MDTLRADRLRSRTQIRRLPELPETMTLEDMLAERERLLAEKTRNAEILARCKDQIADAKADGVNGEPTDTQWFAAVSVKVRRCGQVDQRIASQLAKLRERIREAHIRQTAAEKVAAKSEATDGDTVRDLLIKAIRLIEMALDIM